MNNAKVLFPVVGTAILFAACSAGDRISGPSREILDPSSLPLAAVTCTANTISGTLTCGTDGGAGSEEIGIAEKKLRPVILGGQDQYVRLTSSNIAVVADTFAFDVEVENLIPQLLGTTDGSTPDSAGIRVFFAAGPTSTGSGAIVVANPDGVETFTASNQPYFQYAGLLAQGLPSGNKRWKLQFEPEVENFIFTVYVSAAVRYPNGYVDEVPYVLTLDFDEMVILPGVARSVTGVPVSEAVEWSTENPLIGEVIGSTAIAGPVPGFTTLTAVSGARPAIYTTAVSVCPSAVITNGMSVPGSIESTDCFSSFGGADNRPTTSHYGDLYRVTLSAGETLTVTLDPDGELDPNLTLAAPRTGIVVARNDDDDTGELGLGSRIVYTAAETGVYVIEASSFSLDETGPYVISVQITSDM